MGNENKGQNKKQLQDIGKRANEETTDSFFQASTISLTNDVIVGNSKSNPDLDYKKLNFLGEGSFASVYRVQNRITDTVRAMKVINKSSTCTAEDEKEIFNEINILKTMDHPGILKIFEFYSNKESYSIVMELCPYGELFQEILDHGPFDEKYTAYVMYQIFSGINYCHKMNIIHRDLKPENILIMEKETEKDRDGFPRVKICDFGTSKMVEKGAIQKKLVGSSYYIAPEVLKKRYDEKCDIWSCGVIMYILLSARPPFGGEDDNEIMDRVATGKYSLSEPPFDKCSKSAIDLIKKLLEMNVSKRLSAEEALKHPWFKENKSKELYNKINDGRTLKQMIENLKNYRRESVIQETALAYLVHNFSQMRDVINACKLFNQIDTSGDGKINEEELYKGLESMIKTDTLRNDVHLIYNNLDMDGNGYIEYEEFVRAAVNKEKFIRENVLRFAFRYFDKDGSGEITFDEIEEVFKSSVKDQSKIHESLQTIIGEVDTNGDGKISFDEFSAIMKKMLKKQSK